MGATPCCRLDRSGDWIPGDQSSASDSFFTTASVPLCMPNSREARVSVAVGIYKFINGYFTCPLTCQSPKNVQKLQTGSRPLLPEDGLRSIT